MLLRMRPVFGSRRNMSRRSEANASLGYYQSEIFSENRFPLLGITPWRAGFYFPGKRAGVTGALDFVVAAATTSSQPPAGAMMAVASSGCGTATKDSALSLAVSSCFGATRGGTALRFRA